MTGPEDYQELADRLCTAALSYQLGNKGMDYTRKHYLQSPAGDYWRQLAAEVLLAMGANQPDSTGPRLVPDG